MADMDLQTVRREIWIALQPYRLAMARLAQEGRIDVDDIYELTPGHDIEVHDPLKLLGNPLYMSPDGRTGWQSTADGVMVLLMDGATRYSFLATHLNLINKKLLGATNYRAQVGVVFDGGGSAIQVGQEFSLRVENGFRISGWHMLADQTGSIKIDVWKDTWANYPPTDGDTITNANEPEIAADNKAFSVGVVGDGWTYEVDDGDVLTFHVDSCSTIERCTLILVGTKT